MEYKIFQDFETFAASVRDVNSTMMFQNPKDGISSIGQLQLSGIHLQLGRVGSGNIVEGVSRADGYLFYLPMTKKIEYLANGNEIDVNSMAIFEPECDFYMATTVEHDWSSAFIPTDLLPPPDKVSEPLFNREKSRFRVSQPNQTLLNRFRAFMANIDFASTQCSDFRSTPAARLASEELKQILFSLLYPVATVKPNLEGRPKITREKIITRCRNFIEEYKSQPVTVKELAAVCQVSERTLRTTFKEYFGIGPARYLKLRQLYQVHRALRVTGDKKVLISDVMAEYGVWEFGRFAGEYRRLFGEMPSQTLSNIKKCQK
ncbi:MAG: helix-turn-helix domain-containing protein [Crocosphaera sp.]